MIDYNQVFKDTKETLNNELVSNRFKFVDFWVKDGDSILDIGCSNGNLMRNLTKKVDYLGLDISELAVKDNPNKSIIGNAEDFKIDTKFNKIVCLETLEHLEYPEKAIECMIKHLKPKGMLLITVPKDKLIMDKTHLQIFYYKDILKLCQKHTMNFSIQPIKKYDVDEDVRMFSIRMVI